MHRATRISAILMTSFVLSRMGWAMFSVEELTTDRPSYKQGELVEIDLNVSNNGTEDVVLWTGACGCPAFDTEVLDAGGSVVAWFRSVFGACIAMPCGYHYPPGFSGDLFDSAWEQHLGEFPFDPYNPNSTEFAPPGEYRLRVSWHDGTFLYSEPFEITQRAPPIPATSALGVGLLAAAIGIAGVVAVRRSWPIC